MSSAPFSLKARIASFRYAFSGLAILLREEHNARVHFFTGAAVVLLAVLLNVSAAEWMVLLLAITLVISLEAINSAVEKICDLLVAEYHPLVKSSKDLAAAAVLVAAIGASIVGLIIFLPKIIALW